MHNYLGIVFALVALFSWGFSDFFAQKSIRISGIWKTLFISNLLGFFVFLPFIWNNLIALGSQQLILLILTSIVYSFASLFYFFGLGKGKIALIEPLNGLEILIVVGLGATLGGEKLSLSQIFLILAVCLGIVLVITVSHTKLHYHKRFFEKGVILAGIGAIGMALTNFLVGISSREISPVLTVWFIHTAIVLACFVFLVYTHEFKKISTIPKKSFVLAIEQGILNNIGWIGFALATTIIPTSIATTVSEGYIAMAVGLGIFINRERLKFHQKIGAIFAIFGVIILSAISK
jgi:uncharacterized membrane protein